MQDLYGEPFTGTECTGKMANTEFSTYLETPASQGGGGMNEEDVSVLSVIEATLHDCIVL